jgi:hypothetical protein
LLEVTSHLESCLASLKANAEAAEERNTVRIHHSVNSEKIKQMMRQVEDDVISQMSIIYNRSNHMVESDGANNTDGQVKLV